MSVEITASCFKQMSRSRSRCFSSFFFLPKRFFPQFQESLPSCAISSVIALSCVSISLQMLGGFNLHCQSVQNRLKLKV